MFKKLYTTSPPLKMPENVSVVMHNILLNYEKKKLGTIFYKRAMKNITQIPTTRDKKDFETTNLNSNVESKQISAHFIRIKDRYVFHMFN